MPDMLVKLYEKNNIDTENLRLDNVEIQVKRAMALDKELILSFVESNFYDIGPGWVGECELSLTRLPVSCFIAEYQASVIGFACYDTSAKGFFGPMGVSENFRKQGIGKMLMVNVFRAMAYEGYGYAIIPWVSSASYYRKAVGAMEIMDSDPGIYGQQIKK